MSTQKEKIDRKSSAQINVSSNKSNISERENLIESQQISNNIKIKNEFSLSEMSKSKNNNSNISNNISINNKILKNNIKKNSSNNNTSNIKISISHSNFKNKNHQHIIIDSNSKKPNLIKNIHYKQNIKRSNDSLRYQPISSFEQKLSKQLSRISNKYTTIKNRKFFNNQLTSTNLYWQNFPDYEIYRQLKELETRNAFPYAFTKPRLKPLISQHKDKLGLLAKNLYMVDQVERFKKLLKKQKKVQVDHTAE